MSIKKEKNQPSASTLVTDTNIRIAVIEKNQIDLSRPGLRLVTSKPILTADKKYATVGWCLLDILSNTIVREDITHLMGDANDQWRALAKDEEQMFLSDHSNYPFLGMVLEAKVRLNDEKNKQYPQWVEMEDDASKSLGEEDKKTFNEICEGLREHLKSSLVPYQLQTSSLLAFAGYIYCNDAKDTLVAGASLLNYNSGGVLNEGIFLFTKQGKQWVISREMDCRSINDTVSPMSEEESACLKIKKILKLKISNWHVKMQAGRAAEQLKQPVEPVRPLAPAILITQLGVKTTQTLDDVLRWATSAGLVLVCQLENKYAFISKYPAAPFYPAQPNAPYNSNPSPQGPAPIWNQGGSGPGSMQNTIVIEIESQ